MISEHDEVTVARGMPNMAMIKTIMDAAPYGAGEPRAGEQPHNPAAAIPTPMVPAPETQAAPVVVPAAGAPPKGVAKTMIMSQTLSDPEMEARARAEIDAAIGRASTAQAPPIDAPKPKANASALSGTMMMGGDENAAVAAAIAAARGGAPVDPNGPTAPQASHAPQAPYAAASIHEESTRKDASPLSRSVLAPQSWGPPPVPAPGDASPVLPPVAAPPVAAPPAGGPLRTMLGMPATDLGVPGAAQHQQPQQQQPPPQQLPQRMATQLGGTVAMSDASAARDQALQQAAQQQQPKPLNAQKTMMGVAIPGIAPTHGHGAMPPASINDRNAGGGGGAGGPSSLDLRSKQSTMLGVAIPGIAPTHGAPEPGPHSHGQHAHQAGAPSRGQPNVPSKVQNTALGMMAVPDVKIVPRPKTLIDEPLPQMPELRPKKGVPAVALVGIVAALVLVGGGIITFFALRAGAPLTAVPQLDENGRESLKIGCTSCPDGTKVSLGASSSTVTAGAALLPLPAPLSIGENELSVKVERPAGGRNEDVKIHVPVAYRVRADLATLSARPPAITVRIEATPGSEVKVDDKPVPLDATGRGAYAIDLSKETEGTGEPKTFERKIPFAITPKGGKLETGELTARTAIVPLALDAPGRELVTDKASAAVSGQTRPGTTVAIDGQNVAVDPQGRFGVRVELAAPGEKALEIVASAPPLAPRIAKVKVTRVASLAEAAKEQDAQSPIGYDAFGAEPASKAGQKAVVEGDVVDVRITAGHTILLIDDKRKCTKGATCLVRVVHGDEDRVARGDIVRAYGRILGASAAAAAAGGKSVPDIEASLVLPIKVAK